MHSHIRGVLTKYIFPLNAPPLKYEIRKQYALEMLWLQRINITVTNWNRNRFNHDAILYFCKRIGTFNLM